MVRPSVPAPEAERGPSPRSLTPLEIGPGLPPLLPPLPRPRPFRGDPTPSFCPPPTRPSIPDPPALRPRRLCRCSAPPPSHPGASLWAAMARGDAPQDRRVGDPVGCGRGYPGGRGQRRPAAFGRSEAQSRRDGTTIPISLLPQLPEPG